MRWPFVHFTYVPTSKCTKEHTVLRVCIIQSLREKKKLFYNARACIHRYCSIRFNAETPLCYFFLTFHDFRSVKWDLLPASFCWINDISLLINYSEQLTSNIIKQIDCLPAGILALNEVCLLQRSWKDRLAVILHTDCPWYSYEFLE